MFSTLLRRNFCTKVLGMELKEVTKHLETFAPASLAGSWDNVGLLIEPSGQKIVKKLILTNDLTEAVMQESLNAQVDMIISYHPPIFRPLKKITSKSWKVRVTSAFSRYFKNFSFTRKESSVCVWRTELRSIHRIRLGMLLTVASMIGFWLLLVSLLVYQCLVWSRFSNLFVVRRTLMLMKIPKTQFGFQNHFSKNFQKVLAFGFSTQQFRIQSRNLPLFQLRGATFCFIKWSGIW